jgi:hypothetical protein
MPDLIFQFKVGLHESGEWTWSKRLGETVLHSSSESFDSLNACLSDARHNGYSGELLDAAERLEVAIINTESLPS